MKIKFNLPPPDNMSSDADFAQKLLYYKYKKKIEADLGPLELEDLCAQYGGLPPPLIWSDRNAIAENKNTENIHAWLPHNKMRSIMQNSYARDEKIVATNMRKRMQEEEKRTKIFKEMQKKYGDKFGSASKPAPSKKQLEEQEKGKIGPEVGIEELTLSLRNLEKLSWELYENYFIGD